MSKNHRSGASWLLFIGFLTLIGILAFPRVTQAKPTADTIITTDITVDTTWNLAGSPYIINTGLDIWNGATLTIEAGVQVKFNAGMWLDVENTGTLIVNGSSGSPVVFTSNEGSPLPGDWYYVNVNNGGTAAINYCEIANAGFSSTDALRTSSTGSVTVSNCDIHDNLDEGILVSGGAGVKPVFTNVTIRDNGDAAVEQGGNTSPIYNNITMTGNGNDGIYLTGDYNAPVVLDGSGLNGGEFIAWTEIDINGGSIVTVTAGTTFSFLANKELDINNGGELRVLGTESDPVVFTSNAAVPAPGDWYSIAVNGTGKATIDHCEIAYAGASNLGALSIFGTGNVNVSNCDIHHNLEEGVDVGTGAGVKPTFANTTIRDNVGPAVRQGSNAGPTYDNMTLTGNGDDGIYLVGDYNVPVTLDGSGLNGQNFVAWTDIDINGGGIITFTAGTTLTFLLNQQLDVNNGGELRVLGTAENPVVFTSNMTTTNPGDWYNIAINGTGKATINHCEIAYAGASNLGALEIYSTNTVTVDNCDIHHNQDEGLQIGGGAGVNPTFSNSTIRDNGGAAGQQGGNTGPTYDNVTLTGNGDDGLYLVGDYDVPVTLDGSGLNGQNFIAWTDIDINGGGIITFTAGTTLTFLANKELDVNNGGELRVLGTAENPVVFTSNEAAPTPGYWYSIAVNGTGKAAFNHCEIAYAGASNLGALEIHSAQGVTVDNCDIHHNLDEGLQIGSGTGVNPAFSNSTIRDNGGAAGQQGGNTGPTYDNVTLTGNGDDGLYLVGDYDVPVTLDGSGLNGANFIAWTNIDINNGGIITFTAGTTLTFLLNQELDINFGGELRVLGAAGNPVIFTSNDPTPAAGDWYNIAINNGGKAAFNHCEIAYGGFGNTAALDISTKEAMTIDNCDIHNNQDEGVKMWNGSGVNPGFTNVTIHDNGGGAVEQGGNTSPSYDNVTLTGNGEDGILLVGDYSAPVILDGSGLNGQNFVAATGINIWSGGVLTFTAGTTLTFATNQWLSVDNGGELQVNGSVDNPVLFTSNASTPAPGDWYAISVNNGGTAALSYCEVAFAGVSNYDALRIYTTNPVLISNCDIHDNLAGGLIANSGTQLIITNTLVHHNSQEGLIAASGSNMLVTNSTIAANDIGLHANAATVTLVNTLITHNTTAGLRATAAPTFDLQYNDIYNPDGLDYDGLADQTGNNGNISGDPRYVDLGGQDLNLGSGSAAIDAATSNAAPLTDFLDNPRYDDPSIEDIGGGSLTYYDMGALERQLPSSPVNLVIESISVDKANVAIGDTVTIDWVVRNDQVNDASGDWFDAVFASRDDVWDFDDTLVGEIAHTGGLSPTLSYHSAITFTNPPSVAGDLFFIVRADARQSQRETIESDNEITATVQLTVPQLFVGAPLQNQFSAAGEAHYYQINAPAGRTLSITVESDASSGILALFLSEDAIPDPFIHDARSPLGDQPDQQLIYPQTGVDTLYLMVKAEAGQAALSPYTLLAELPGFKIRRISPAVAGNTGLLTLQVEAADLTRWTQVSLISGTQVLEADTVYYDDNTRILATFNLTGTTPGLYDVNIHSEEESVDYNPSTDSLENVIYVNGDDTLVDGLEITDTLQTGLTTRLLLPGAARLGRLFPFQIEVFNDSNLDIPSPVILVRSPNDTPLSLTSQVELDDPTEIQLLILSQIGSPDTLKAGEKIIVQLYGLAAKLPGSQLAIQDLSAPGTALDWAPFEAQYHDGTPDLVWQQTWANFLALVGNSWDQYLEVLLATATGQTVDQREPYVAIDHLIDDLLVRAAAGQNDLSEFSPYPTDMDEPFDLPDDFGLDQAASETPRVILADPLAFPSADRCDDFRPRSLPSLIASEGVAVALSGLLATRQSGRTAGLFLEFSTHGSPQYMVFPESDEVVQGNLRANGFRNSIDTQRVTDGLVRKAIERLIERLKPSHANSYPIGMFPANVQVEIDIKELVIKGLFTTTEARGGYKNYAQQLIWTKGAREIPGSIAGGIGETVQPSGHSLGSDVYGDDFRTIEGGLLVTRRVDDEGKTTYFNVQSKLSIWVADTIDFCPGNVSSGLTYQFLKHLAALEANDRAHDIGFETEFRPLDPYFYIIPASKVPEEFDPDDRPSPSCEEGGSQPECSEEIDDVVSWFSSDPNEIVGPAGAGEGNWIKPLEPLPYIIRFENDPEVANAPAQEVFITNQLSPDMDWNTFEFVSFGFGSYAEQVPSGRQAYETQVNWSNQDGSPLLVEVKAGLNRETGLVSWAFRSLDPETGLLPFDPLAGFLPVNDKDLHNGEGFVTYLVRQKAGLAGGTAITNQANIVFDINDPIVTNVYTNTIDTGPPTSTVEALPATSRAQFEVSWTGDDPNGSGIASYDIYVSEEGGPFILWQQAVTATMATFTGVVDLSYGFYSVATDQVGYRQPTPAGAQAVTKVEAQTDYYIYLPMIIR